MKNIFLLMIIGLLVLSCEDNRMMNLPGDQFYIVHSGEQVKRALIQESTIRYEIGINRSGVENSEGTIELVADQAFLDEYNAANNTSYELLPQEYYTLGKTSFHFDAATHKQSTFLEIDVKGIESLQGIRTRKYVVPLKLNSTNKELTSSEGAGAIYVPEISGGIRENSYKSVWAKMLWEMGINNENHWTSSIATSDEYLFVNTRSSDLRYYDLLTGEHKGTIELPFKSSLGNFTVANDDNNNLLVSNLRNANDGGDHLQTIYLIKGTNPPVKFIESAHPYPNGRKISVTGDLEGDAIIMSGVEWAPKLLYWIVKDGNVVSQQLEVIELNASDATWNIFGDAMAVGTDLSNGYYVCGYGPQSILGYFDESAQLINKYDLAGAGYNPNNGFINQSVDIATFNGATYMAVEIAEWDWHVHSALLDITFSSNLSLSPTSPEVLVRKFGPIWCYPNSNSTADVSLQVLKDGKHLMVYTLATNGSITAEQFDCVVE